MPADGNETISFVLLLFVKWTELDRLLRRVLNRRDRDGTSQYFSWGMFTCFLLALPGYPYNNAYSAPDRQSHRNI